MLRVRTTHDAADFVGAPDDPSTYVDQISNEFAEGSSRPDWCFVVEDNAHRVGRIGFRIEPTMSDPAWLGTLPGSELSTFGLHLPWGGDFKTPGRSLFEAAADALTGAVPDLLEIRINNEAHPHHGALRRLLDGRGFDLFAEKQGFTWAGDVSEVEVPARLTFRTVADVGVDEYRQVMGRCGQGTLDRNDRYYWDGCGPENWARQMTEYIADDDRDMWLIGYLGNEPAGYVAVGSNEEWGSTINHIGVVPEHRGNGYIDDLIAAGTAAAQEQGITSMLSDVDVVNAPMVNAMRRAGHREDARPWHVWAYRTDVTSLATSS